VSLTPPPLTCVSMQALHKEKKQLEKEKGLKEADISVAKARCTELQMLKFGQLIDLESLDQVAIDTSEKALRSKIEDIDQHNFKEVREVVRHHEKLKRDLLEATQKNTTLLMEIAELTGKQVIMEKELVHGNKSIPVADKSPVVKLEIEERNRLMALVELQAKELDILKAEINLLRRKGAPVYANGPVVEGAK
jgi:cilia- and flagella-associated protein 44